ncbi:hypothetical protein HYFRA_00004152 [Hymenoscyphus fraxineus]|uniref:Uncharacterized protein n=1 Tax=Hymenoscyphus fraxineus TaxID=746836 RepID=A0A9N9KQN1_9HELO|nr:hypothetical protein HYFRA_00004152 [Hymenoscyphus fraxineus]
MGKKIHRIHRGNDSWKKDIEVLTCILRLRCQPPVTYVNIAEYLLAVWPVAMLRFAGHQYSAARDLPADLDANKELKEEFMNVRLPRIFTTCENEEEEAWKMAKEWDDTKVREILKHTGLGELGYEIADEREMALQILWRKTDDFRAGSFPEPYTMTSNYGVHHGRLRQYKPTPGQRSLLSVSEESPLRRNSVESGKSTIQVLRLGPHPHATGPHSHSTKRGTRRMPDAQRSPFIKQAAEIQTASNSFEDAATTGMKATTTGKPRVEEMLRIGEE